MKILDCTLRDGGYYTDWHFDTELVNNYLSAMDMSGIDIVELGLRSPAKNKFYGPYVYSSDEFLNSLSLPKNCEIAVMINAKEYIKEDKVDKELFNSMFKDAKKSPVNLVRIAAHYIEIPHISEMVDILSEKGYEVAANLMQTGNKTKEEVIQAVYDLKDLNIRSLYFADSFGDMDAEKIRDTIKTMRTHWQGELGIHAHNNMGLALQNTKVAFESGATYLDCTITGMGRGAGNTQTEYLLLEMASQKEKYKPSALFPLVLKDFTPLQDVHKWGPNLLYYLSAEYNIHPTYVQEILKTNQTTTNVITALENLKGLNASSYNKDKLNQALKLNFDDCEGTWSPEELMYGRDVLVITNGPSVSEHKVAIENYIKTKKPFVISLNITKSIEKENVDLIAACHPVKLLADLDKYNTLDKPLMIPFNSLDAELQKHITETKVLNYGIKLSKGEFSFEQTSCHLPTPLVLAYVLAAANSAKSNRILVAGLDGYGKGDDRQDEMENLLSQYFSKKETLDIISITPTTYNLKQTTVYNMEL